MPSFWVAAQHTSSDYEEEFSYKGKDAEDVIKKLQTNGYDVFSVVPEIDNEQNRNET
jgi:hypothetical protein